MTVVEVVVGREHTEYGVSTGAGSCGQMFGKLLQRGFSINGCIWQWWYGSRRGELTAARWVDRVVVVGLGIKNLHGPCKIERL